MDDKKWIENIVRFRFVSWLFAVILVFIGIKLASLVNSFVYVGTKLDPSSTYFVTVAIVFGGYSLWSTSIAVNIVGKVIKELFRAIVRTVFRSRKLDNEDIKTVSSQIFNEDMQLEVLSNIRGGSKSFVRSGLMLGILLGCIHIFSVTPSPGLKGFVVYAAYGLMWGYIWYRIAWLGFVPLPSPDEE